MPEVTATVAAVRGAIQVSENRADLIQAATARLSPSCSPATRSVSSRS